MSTSLTVWKVYLLVFPNSKVYVGVTKYSVRVRLSAIQIKVQNTSEMKAAKSRATKLQMSDPHQRVQIAEKMSKWHGLVFRKVKDINPFRWDNNCYNSWTSLPTSVTTYDLIATGREARHFTLALAKGAIEVCN